MNELYFLSKKEWYDRMMNGNNEYSDIVKGEVNIIHDEIEKFLSLPYTANLNVSNFLERVAPHLASIEQKLGKNSIDYIYISTLIVDIISERVLAYIKDESSASIIEKMSATETVKFYASQRDNLIEALCVCKTLEVMNMDYEYRIKTFNVVKKELENNCREKGIDTRTTTQKTIEQIKEVGTITGVVAKETAGCVVELAIKIAIVAAIFWILMTIIGVK